MNILAKYNQSKTITFDLFNPDGVDMNVTAAFAAGDVKIMKDEGVEANTTNLPTDEGSSYSLVLTATEMTAARIRIIIIDSATKVWLDTSIGIDTYGHANAEHAFDWDTANVTLAAATHTGATIPNVTTVATTTTNSDMRGTDSALLAVSAPANFGDMAITATTGMVTVGSLATAAILSIWHQLTSAIATAGTIGKLLVDNINGTISSRMAETSINTTGGSVDNVTTLTGHTAQTGDSFARLGAPAGASIAADLVTNKTHLTDVKGATFSGATDSLEAIRDRGDTAWITGGGGGITDILNVQPLIPPEIDLSNTATWRLGLMLTNALDDLPSTAEITPGTIQIDRKALGGATWSTIIASTACSELPGVIYYDAVFDSGSGYAEGDSIRIRFKSQKITVAANDYEIFDTSDRYFYTSIRQTMRGTNSAALATGLVTAQNDLDVITGADGVKFASADQASMVDDFYDEGLSGHNVGGSGGKALRQILESNVSVESSVNDASATNISFITALTETANNHFVDVSLVFVDGDLTGQSRPVLSYNGTTKEIVLEEALTAPPANGDGFIIKTDHVHPVTQVQSGLATEAKQDIITAEIGTAGAGLTALGGMSAAMKTEVLAEVVKLFTTQMAESYAANGIAPTLAQSQFAVHQMLMEFVISGTSLTVKKLDSTTTAFIVTLNDPANPTGATR